MADIRTVENLDDAVSVSFAWRKRELALVETMIRDAKYPSVKADFLIRSGITMLYAHWEGFIRECAAHYIEFISMQRRRYDELSVNFVALGMRRLLNEATQAIKPSIHNQVAHFFLSEMSSRCTLAAASSLSTKSNLSSDVLYEITAMLGIAYTDYESKRHLIDERLLKTRNHVAHGKELLIDNTSFLELHAEVIGMLEVFRNQVVNAAAMRSFLRVS